MGVDKGIPDETWRDQAECLGLHPNEFMDNIEGRLRRNWSKAEEACDNCKVTDQCLEHALVMKDVWSFSGGMSPLDRLPLLIYGKNGPPPPDPNSEVDPEKQRQLDRRLLERMRKGAVPMPGRTCEGCGEIYDARSGVQRLCEMCRCR